jgi:hypothetical protein
MTSGQLKQFQEELIRLKSQDVITMNEKYRIQKLQQLLDSIFDEE